MSADFWSGYVSGAIGILIGNPLDIIKTKLQAGSAQHTSEFHVVQSSPQAPRKSFERLTQLARGAAAPILGYGALNAILFMTYNRSLALMTTGDMNQWPERSPAWSIWTAGALGGLATFLVSAPTELVKCRAQVSHPPKSSLRITKELWSASGLRGLYLGGGITSIRDAVGYGFYFYTYDLSKQHLTHPSDTTTQEALKVLLCGGLAGVATWVSIFPLDVIKTRVQTWDLHHGHIPAAQPLLGTPEVVAKRPSTFTIARAAYRAEGTSVFFRGLGICSARAFIVNAVQWAVYEWMMRALSS
ncbi:hypothetical protein DOTSEDRAFT_134075 [Dothistroma septosporum NZE10]|uniref:Mitochondrial carrier-like protein n=1 Tax=Dothistroma septosporum (strain NZE10 / CBS 128990) TaxID=675120 RepID=N1PI53_DOTSN|nr:hypothetical protein DOTSEDRAFT_134075 [Dothistroma septosporum NZE10]